MNDQLKPCPFCGSLVTSDDDYVTVSNFSINDDMSMELIAEKRVKTVKINCPKCRSSIQYNVQRWQSRPIEDALRARAEKAEAEREALGTDNDRLKSLLHELSQPASRALDSILYERERQEKKWGEQNHNPFIYQNILMEEVGEFSEAILQTVFGGPKGGRDNMRKEAVHAAAVAMAIVECLDRNKWDWIFVFPEPPTP